MIRTTTPEVLWPAIAAALGIAVVVSGLGNGFAYDDIVLLVNDPRIQSLHTLRDRLAGPWWHTGLYRPVSLGALAIQWIVTEGAPITFRIVGTALYATICALVVHLARLSGASWRTAGICGVVFAVHPVHSEVTANVVGQAELLSALAAVGAVIWYLKSRTPLGLRRQDALVVAGLALLAANAKEGGYVVPGLLVAAELLVVRDGRPLSKRAASLREATLVLTAVLLGSLAIRKEVLGSLSGETPLRSLAELGVVDRAIAMLAVVPEWGRLLVWPVRLQSEYGPPALQIVPEFGQAHLLGAVLGVAMLGAIVMSVRRAPLIAFGLVWVVISLAPVTNVLTPTGLFLAERTLFLPSVGLSLAVAGCLPLLNVRLLKPTILHPILATAGIVVLLLSAWRTVVRQPEWRDSITIHGAAARDAPTTARARRMYALALIQVDSMQKAEVEFRAATSLWDRDPHAFREFGQLLRQLDRCAEGVPLFRVAVAMDSTDDIARSRLIECLIVERRWDEAEREIARGLAQGVGAYNIAARRVSAGRARSGAP